MNRTKLLIRILALLLSILIIITSCAGIWFYLNAKATGNGENTIELTVPRGMSIIRIGELLVNNNLIKNELIFRLAIKITNTDKEIKWGRYELNNGMNIWEIIDMLSTGVPSLVSITIPEGYNIFEIADYLVLEGFIENSDEFTELCHNQDIIGSYNIPYNTMEGYLYPDTYHIPREYSGEQIIKMMADEFFKNFSSEKNREQLEKLNLTFHEFVTLASLVEEETGISEERTLVAGVFYNRYKKYDMRMECDPTVAYGLKLEGLWQGDLRSSMPRVNNPRRNIDWFAFDSPYNTYKYYGLPPSPISCPGYYALNAALNPDNTEYLFFVAKADGSGEHYFSRTGEEHSQAIIRARANQRGSGR